MVDEQTETDALALGIDIDRLIPPEEQLAAPKDYELWPQHARAWQLFVASATQWRLVMGMNGAYWMGLEMPGVDVIRKAHGISDQDWSEVLNQLQVLEREAKRLRNEASADS